MVTKREQKDGRVINLPVYVSNHITDEMIRLFLESGKAMSVNAGRISEQVVLPYLEKHFKCKGEVVDADGYDHLFKNGIKNEHKKLVITGTKTTAIAKRLGENKRGKCDTISFHHPAQNAIYVIKADTFYKHVSLNHDKYCNTYDVMFYRDMQLEGKGKRLKSYTRDNTEMLLNYATKLEL
jgi:hypothetical protein